MTMTLFSVNITLSSQPVDQRTSLQLMRNSTYARCGLKNITFSSSNVIEIETILFTQSSADICANHKLQIDFIFISCHSSFFLVRYWSKICIGVRKKKQYWSTLVFKQLKEHDDNNICVTRTIHNIQEHHWWLFTDDYDIYFYLFYLSTVLGVV